MINTRYLKIASVGGMMGFSTFLTVSSDDVIVMIYLLF